MRKQTMATRSRSFALKQMLSLLGRCSDQSIIKLTRAAEVVAREPEHKEQIVILTPFPGTWGFREFAAEGRIVDTDWNHYDGAHVIYRPLV